MNTHDAFDRQMREAHARAVASVSPRTRLQLQFRRGAASVPPAPVRSLAWPLAAACAAGALAIGLQWLSPEPAAAPEAATPIAATVPATDTAVDDAYIALDESPDLYLWLASDEAAMLAME